MTFPLIIPVYRPNNVSFSYGKGVYLYDDQNNRYIDFTSGVGASSLGHAHPILVDALQSQGEKLWHVSNLYHIPEAQRLAKLLISNSFADTAFFVNSGAEAVECGLKIARSYQNGKQKHERYRVLTLKKSFHGRTYTACSANDPKGFSPLLYPYVDWFESVDCDISAIKQAIQKGDIGTILLEPVQGEGGVNVIDSQLLKEIRQLCIQEDILLFFDCVQCGSGRTGKFFAYDHINVQPDICSMAKGMGGGFPLGACLATKNAAQFMSPGMHGSTYGGNPLATTIGYTVVNEILRHNFLDNVTKNGQYLKEKIKDLSYTSSIIEGVKGIGLMIGVKIRSDINNRSLMEKLTSSGLLVCVASDNIIRMLPPLIISKSEIDEALEVFAGCLKKHF